MFRVNELVCCALKGCSEGNSRCFDTMHSWSTKYQAKISYWKQRNLWITESHGTRLPSAIHNNSAEFTGFTVFAYDFWMDREHSSMEIDILNQIIWCRHFRISETGKFVCDRNLAFVVRATNFSPNWFQFISKRIYWIISNIIRCTWQLKMNWQHLYIRVGISYNSPLTLSFNVKRHKIFMDSKNCGREKIEMKRKYKRHIRRMVDKLSERFRIH